MTTGSHSKPYTACPDTTGWPWQSTCRCCRCAAPRSPRQSERTASDLCSSTVWATSRFAWAEHATDRTRQRAQPAHWGTDQQHAQQICRWQCEVIRYQLKQHWDDWSYFVPAILKHWPETVGIYLFGSYATVDERGESDVDFALTIPRGCIVTNTELALSTCRSDLEMLLGREVDLLNHRLLSI